MPKREIEKRHDALVAQIAREPEKFFCGEVMAGEKIYARSEPWSFGHARKRVDGFVVFQMQSEFVFEIVVFELKLGHNQISNGYAQLKTVVDFFAEPDRWLGWAKEILKTVPGQWKVWLTIELLTTGQGAGENGNEKIESYNLFPDYLLPKHRFVGFYPATPAQRVAFKKELQRTGVTVHDYIKGR